jgi:uncharacterized protein (DUF433 family)
MSTIAYPHINVDASGEPRIADTGFKVRVLIEDHLSCGASAEDLSHRYPQLSLAQIYGALVYYYDHKPEMDQKISELNRAEKELRAQLENPQTTARLRQAMANRTDG